MCHSEFERSAFEILDELYKRSRDKTQELVERPLMTWNLTSVYKLAVDADVTTFKIHDSFQACLDKMWYGELKTNLPLWKVRLPACFIITSGEL